MKLNGPIVATLLALSSVSTTACYAAPSQDTWAELNQNIIRDHLIPRYDTLASQSKNLVEATNTLCTTSASLDNLTHTQNAFRSAMDAWQGIQHIQFGPITLLMRNFSLEYWPDKKNIGARQLRQALSTPDARYDQEFFHAASVSIKGFPALERILFASSAPEKLVQGSAECNMAQGIARYINDNVASVHAEWEAEAQAMAVVGEDENYETHNDAATAFMKSLVEPLEVIRDTKLLAPIGESLEASRWKKSESWRSGISIQNIRTNIAALHELYSGTHPSSVKTILAANGQDKMADQIEALFSKSEQQLAAINEPADVMTAELRDNILAATATLKTLKNVLIDAMQLLDIQLGFNSRDGD